jgi:hypothetical protein
VMIVGFHCFLVNNRRTGELPLILARLLENNSSALNPWPSPLICKIICSWSWESVSFSIENINEDMISPFKILIDSNLATQGWWTSGLYTLALNNFVWASTGATFTFTNWAAGNPITPTAAQLANGVCVHVGTSSLTTQFWDEQSCNSAFPYICQ